jgi:hypothetical protein
VLPGQLHARGPMGACMNPLLLMPLLLLLKLKLPS